MTTIANLAPLLTMQAADSASAILIGNIVEIAENGQVFVDYSGNLRGPIKAKTVMIIAEKDRESLIEKQALLLFAENEPLTPILLGIINESVYLEDTADKSNCIADDKREIHVDGEKIFFDSKNEITIRCGKAAIIMKSDGNIVIKGSKLVSRSSGLNKIKGLSVSIN